MSMIPVNRKFLRGDIYYANLEPHLGSEQGGIRPVVVVQNNTANCYSPNLIVAPVTSNTGTERLCLLRGGLAYGSRQAFFDALPQ